MLAQAGNNVFIIFKLSKIMTMHHLQLTSPQVFPVGNVSYKVKL